MFELQHLHTGREIADALQAETAVVSDFFSAIPTSAFFAAPPDTWSPADNLHHLLLSTTPVLRALRIPRGVLRFGKIENGGSDP